MVIGSGVVDNISIMRPIYDILFSILRRSYPAGLLQVLCKMPRPDGTANFRVSFHVSIVQYVSC